MCQKLNGAIWSSFVQNRKESLKAREMGIWLTGYPASSLDSRYHSYPFYTRYYWVKCFLYLILISIHHRFLLLGTKQIPNLARFMIKAKKCSSLDRDNRN